MIRFLGIAVVSLLAATAVAQPPAGPPSQTLRIYLARHGQTDWNVEGRTQGATDNPLNATGREQGKQLATRLMSIRFDAVYSSALSRSKETADLVRGSVPLTTLAGLNERHFGKFEGSRTSDAATTAEFDKRRWLADDGLDGGETAGAFAARVGSALETIRTRQPSGTVLVVGHGNTNAVLLQTVFGWTLDEVRSVRQENDEVYLIEVGPGGPRLWKLITASNLRDL